MVLFRRGVWVEQEQVAKELGTRISQSMVNQFYINLPIAKDDNETGTDLAEFVGEKIKALFKKYKLPLKTKIYYIDEIKNIKQFIIDNLKKGNDMMFNFSDRLYNPTSDEGHYSLVSAITGDTVTLCDPWIENKSFWQTKLNDLARETDTIDPMGNKRGIVVFSSPL
jgi:hypothetical protein